MREKMSKKGSVCCGYASCCLIVLSVAIHRRARTFLNANHVSWRGRLHRTFSRPWLCCGGEPVGSRIGLADY